MRNLNRHTIKYNPKVINMFADAAEEYTERATHAFLADQVENMENFKNLDQVRNEVQKLPLFLQKDLTAFSELYEIPRHLSFFNLYYSQLSKFLPPKMAENWQCLFTMDRFLMKKPEQDQDNEEVISD